jgi:ureidoglycolate lyase
VLATLDAPGGGRVLSRLRAFGARAGQGVSYAGGTWHHPLTVLDGPATFVVLMWRDGTKGDEEFVPVATPLTVVLP